MGDTNDDQGQQEETPSFLRNKWEEEQAKSRDLQAKLVQYQQDEQLRDAGLGHLSKRQRGSVLRELQSEGQEFSPEAAMAMATELGYSTTPSTPTPPPNNGDQASGTPPQETLESQEALSALGIMEQAKRAAASNQGSPDLINEMKSAKTKEELRGLIRDKGPRHGIVHEWDVP